MSTLLAPGIDTNATLHELIEAEFEEHAAVFAVTRRTIAFQIAAVVAIWERTFRSDGKILLFGNGGSAADAQHIAAELVIRYHRDRRALAAIALTTDSSTLTACGNDLGYESLFSRQIEALGRQGDVAMGISTSGTSANVIAGLQAARRAGLYTIGLAGGDGGQMGQLCDALVVVPSRVTARIQEMHITVGHILCKAVETKLGLVGGS